MTERLLTLEDVCVVCPDVNKIRYSPYGYIIDNAGVVYALTRQWVHGVICALLNPEHAVEKGYEPPTTEYDVYHYQRYELDHMSELNLVRISNGMLGTNCNKGDRPATTEQIVAAAKCFIALGVHPQAEIMTEAGVCTLRTLAEYLEQDNTIDHVKYTSLRVPGRGDNQ